MQDRKNGKEKGTDTKVQLLSKAQDFYVKLIPVLRRFPRPERFTLAENIDKQFMKCVELIYQASYQAEDRATSLKALRISLHSTTFSIRAAHELQLIKAGNDEKSGALYEGLARELEAMGKMTSSWIEKDKVAKSNPTKSPKLSSIQSNTGV